MQFSARLFLLLFFTTPLLGQSPENRVALVVGNANYAYNPLTNPIRDAGDVATALRDAGFKVTEKYNQPENALNILLTDFSYSFKNSNTVALFYYAGHGMQYDSNNYLVPVGADTLSNEAYAEWQCVPLERIASKMRDAGNRLNIIILDACRPIKNVTRNKRSTPNGLAPYNKKLPESLIVYATAPGGIAEDRPGSLNGLFTEKLLQHLRTPGLEMQEMFSRVQKDVEERSNGRQIPNIEGTPTHKFYFFEAQKPPSENPVAAPPDWDKDGVADAADRCPNVPGPQYLQGCPDGDGDRVIDIEDDCPETPGSVSRKGCPEKKTGLKWAKVDQSVGIDMSFLHRANKNAGLSLSTHQYFQVHYQAASAIGGFISLGIEDYEFDDVHKVQPAGAAGLGVRLLKRSSPARLYAFAGVLSYKSPEGSPLALECFVTCNLKKVGFQVMYVSNLGTVGGFGGGAHWCF